MKVCGNDSNVAHRSSFFQAAIAHFYSCLPRHGRNQRRRLFLLTPLPLDALRRGGENGGGGGGGILLARGALQLPLVALHNPTGPCVRVKGLVSGSTG